MRRSTTRQRAGYLGTCTNQIGLNMSGNPSSIGRKGSLVKYIGKRVQANQKFCGVVTYQGQMWAKNTEPCVEKAPRGQSFNSGVGHIHSPRKSISKKLLKPNSSVGFVYDTIPPVTNNGGLWIEMPGTYQGGGFLYDEHDLTDTSKMTNWITSIQKFITLQEATGYPIKQIAMKLPAFNSHEYPVASYKWDASGAYNFWNIMADGSGNGLYPGWNTLLAKTPCVIFDLTLPANPWTLLYLAQTNPTIKWLWLPNSGDDFPFTGLNPSFPNGTLGPTDNSQTFSTIVEASNATNGTWDGSYNPIVSGSPSLRQKDIRWDTNKMVDVVNYFRTQVGPLSSTGALINTGIIWEIEGIGAQWSLPPKPNPPPPHIFSLDMLVDTCFTISKNEPGPKLMQTDDWTWGFTSYAKIDPPTDLKNLANSTIVWAAWNKINIINAMKPNIALYVEWYGMVSKGIYTNAASIGVLTALNDAKNGTPPNKVSPGDTLINNGKFVDANKQWETPSATVIKNPMEYRQFTDNSLNHLPGGIYLNNLWKNANYNYQFYNAVGIYKDVNGSPFPPDLYIPLISIEPYFMGGHPSTIDTSWNVIPNSTVKCTNYFPERWPINVKEKTGAAMRSWVNAIGKTVDPSGYNLGVPLIPNTMYFSQTYTMDAFNGAATTTNPPLNTTTFSSYPGGTTPHPGPCPQTP